MEKVAPDDVLWFRDRLRANGWKPETVARIIRVLESEDADEEIVDRDLEELARGQIGQLIIARFKEHGLTRIVGAMLQTQGKALFRKGIR